MMPERVDGCYRSDTVRHAVYSAGYSNRGNVIMMTTTAMIHDDNDVDYNNYMHTRWQLQKQAMNVIDRYNKLRCRVES